MSTSSLETRFDQPGTLSKPGPVGRIVRLLLGIWLLAVCWSYLSYPGAFVRDSTPRWEALVGIAFALWLIPPVVNIGGGTNWRARPRYVAAAAFIAWAAGNMLLTAGLWSPGLGRFAWLFCLYTFGHLGLSFVLAAAIGTPGCEMRAIPHLWTVFTGQDTREHFCPGFLNGLDAWERGERARPT
jgi:hypothetical protein